MAYNACQVANWFIKRARRDGRTLSVMSILKLTYIAHGKYLAKMDAPLFRDDVQAWRHGPIIVSVYRAFRKQGMQVSNPLLNMQDIEDPLDTELLGEVWGKYGDLSFFKLSQLTHVSGGPWDIAVEIGGWYAPISNKLIRQHYVYNAEA